MTVFFVGLQASESNAHPSLPFLGTGSGATLAKWIRSMELPVSWDIKLVNLYTPDDSITPQARTIIYRLGHVKKSVKTRVVALGWSVHEYLLERAVQHFYLPHPSGLNRKLNDKEALADQLKQCKEYLCEA